MNYQHCKIGFGTQHGKEKILKPASQKILQADLLSTDTLFDTDSLGTFSGEIERQGTQREVAKIKARKGLEFFQTLYGLGSEGAFGAHPFLPFINGSIETLVFLDQKHHFELTETWVSSRTNFGHLTTKNTNDLDPFLTKSVFPSHALIVRPNIWEKKDIIFKGIQSFENLKKSIAISCSKSIDRSALIQTDMRAHLNPTRQSEILKVGLRLFRRLSRKCPFCSCPGWGIIGVKRGKTCSNCQYPTKYPTHWIWGCVTCPSTIEKERYDFKETMDPTFCDYCNP